MKFIKVFINSVISGVFFCSLLSLLIYDLNINKIFNLSTFTHLTLFLSIVYGAIITLVCIILFFILQFILGKNFKISFISASFLILSFSLLLILFLIIFKTNYNFFLSFFNFEIQNLLRRQFLFLIGITLTGILFFYLIYVHKKSAVLLITYFILFFSGMAYIVLQRVNYPIFQEKEGVAFLEPKEIDKKITIIGLEGLSFDFIIPLTSEGKLPNLSWLMEEGGWGKLESFSPNEPLTLNNSFNSGKFPSKHHRLSIYEYHMLNIDEEFEIVPRFILFRQLMRTKLLNATPNQSPIKTKDIWKIFEENQTKCLIKDWPYQRKIKKPSPKTETLFNQFFKDFKYETSDIFNNVKQAFYNDCEFEENAMQENNKTQPQILYFLLNGLNIVESFFYKYSFPDLFGYMDQEEINKFNKVIEKYYQFYDQIIGKYLASLKEDELLIVYSPHGTEALPLYKRLIEWMLGNVDISAYHDNAPEGVVFFYGKEVDRGKNIEGIRLIDICPSLLYYLGLHVGKDMDGIAKTSIFTKNFRAENPVSFIFSYDEITIKKKNK